MNRARPRVALALAAAAGLTSVTGCALTSPSSTDTNYTPADGASASVGQVEARNLIVVGSKGAPGLLSGALVNTGSTDQTVGVTSAGATTPVQVTVPAGRLVTLGASGSDATVGVGVLQAPAGATVPITLSSGAGGSVTATVPVLPASGPYATITATATPTPTAAG